MNIEIFADCADKKTMLELAKNPLIKGFTCNPSLMRKAGVTDYEAWAKDIVREIPDKPISFEVIADYFPEMEYQARLISSWGKNVFVKIPVTTTRGEPSYDLIHKLSIEKIKLNVTALMTVKQVAYVAGSLGCVTPSYISVFAGRIADTGRDPVPLMMMAMSKLMGNQKLIWASPREVFNIYQAESIHCDVITATPDILAKLPLNGKDLQEFSLDTVKMFYNDAIASGLKL